MIEVFKTGVTDPLLADLLRNQIHQGFAGYEANFDLQDCDHILRIVCCHGKVKAEAVIELLRDWSVYAEVLADELSPQSFENGLPLSIPGHSLLLPNA
jgi:hypothetical protein